MPSVFSRHLRTLARVWTPSCCLASRKAVVGIDDSGYLVRTEFARNTLMPTPHSDIGIDEYLRNRLMPVEGSIPNLPGIEMYGNSIPAGTVGGDLFEYINFQQRYDIDARIRQAQKLSKEFLDPLPSGKPPRN